MKCYHCGCRLSEKNYCTSCGADVSVYKKIISGSNLFYNEGLEKANVRDLSGAIVSLRQSLKLNKNNIKARNLLGLVYFEMGEVVAALSEWVISKNIRSEKNVADDYINAIQSNPSGLESINQTIKKYNQTLEYCRQGSLDLAVIQLKKVLSLNSRFVRAHQLLALLYIQNEEWEKAKKELDKCTKIDVNNITTLRYEKELWNMTFGEQEKGKPAKTEKGSMIADGSVQYRSGNETIIQPLNVKEQSGFSGLFNIVIGLVIGLAIAWFLILPARIQSAKADIDKELKAVSETSDAKTSTIEELQQQLNTATEDKDALQTQMDSYQGKDGVIRASDNLLQAAARYIEDPADVKAVAENLGKIDESVKKAGASTEFNALYDQLIETIGPKASQSYFASGNDAYKKSDYTIAIQDLKLAFEFDNTNQNALYTLANAYQKSGDKENALETYTKVIELFEGTDRARRSEDSIAQLQAE